MALQRAFKDLTRAWGEADRDGQGDTARERMDGLGTHLDERLAAVGATTAAADAALAAALKRIESLEGELAKLKPTEPAAASGGAAVVAPVAAEGGETLWQGWHEGPAAGIRVVWNGGKLEYWVHGALVGVVSESGFAVAGEIEVYNADSPGRTGGAGWPENRAFGAGVYDEGGRIEFYGHDAEGLEFLVATLNRWGTLRVFGATVEVRQLMGGGGEPFAGIKVDGSGVGWGTVICGGLPRMQWAPGVFFVTGNLTGAGSGAAARIV